MKNEELDELIREGLINSDQDDAQYTNLFEALSQSDRSLELKPDFSKLVVSTIYRGKRSSKDSIWLTIGVLALALISVIVLIITGDLEKLAVLGSLKWYVVIFSFLIITFQKIEKRYLGLLTR